MVRGRIGKSLKTGGQQSFISSKTHNMSHVILPMVSVSGQQVLLIITKEAFHSALSQSDGSGCLLSLKLVSLNVCLTLY